MVKYNEHAIQEAAYYIWQNAGCPQGQDNLHWAMAVEQLNKCCNPSSSCKCSAAKKTVKKSKTTKKKSK